MATKLERLRKYLSDNRDQAGTPDYDRAVKMYRIEQAGGLDAYAESRVGPAKQQPNPMVYDAEGNLRGAGEKFLIGAGKGFYDLATGAGQALGLVSDDTVNQMKERDKPIEQSGLGRAGMVSSQVASFLPTSMIPGANTYTGSALIGAGVGAMQPTAENESRLANSLIGAGGGVVGRALAGTPSKLLNPKVSPQQELLMKEGVPLTPGMAGGNAANIAEQKLMSLPFIGNAIRQGRERSQAAFNKAALNRALAPIGKQVDDTGSAGIAQVRTALNNAYDDLLPDYGVTVDNASAAALKNLDELVQGGLSPTQSNRFNQIMQNSVFGKMTPQGNMSGRSYKDILSNLGRLGREYGKSADPEQRSLGQALNEAQRILKEAGSKQHPEFASALQKIDEGWRNYSVLRRAMSTVGADPDRGFTASQLRNAAKAGDSTVGKRAFGEGQAVMQDLANAGKGVVDDLFPNSGTTDRFLSGAGGVGAGGVGIGAMTGVVDPVTAAIAATAYGTGIAGSKAAYSPVGSKMIEAALLRRPELLRQIGQQSEMLLPYSGAIGGALVQ